MARHPKAPPGFNTREFLQSLKRSPNRGRACQLAQTVATGILVAWSFFNAEAGTPNVPEVSCPDSAVPEDPSAKPRGTPTVFAGTDGAEPQVCKPLVCPPQAPAASASPYPAATALGGNRSGKK